MPTLHPSRIDAVTVFRHGAQITRVVAIADAATCDEVIRVGGLPLSLEERSVRVQVGGVGLVAADVRLGLDVAAEVDPQLAPAESEALREARRGLAGLLDRRRHLEAQRRRLSERIDVSRPEAKEGERPPPSPYRGRRAVVEFQRDLVAELDAASEALIVEIRAAQEALAELEARDREASGARQAELHEMRRTIDIRLERRAGASGGREIRIEYAVPGARWAPAYTVTLDRAMSRATLALRAVVAQRTGEDWQRVKLTLSTADRQRWTELPELQSMRIGRRQATPSRRGWRPPPVGAEALYADYDRHARVHLRSEVTRTVSVQASFEDADDELIKEAGEELDYDGFAEIEEAPMPEVRARRSASTKKRAKLSRSAMPGNSMGRSTGARGGPPMPAPSMPPPGAMPARSAMMPAPQSRSEVLAGGGGAMDTGAFAVLRDEPEPAAAREDPSALLAYGELRMPAADDAGRGKLVAVGRRERIREIVAIRESVRESTEITTILREIDGARATAQGHGALPPGHAFPASVDGFDYAYLAEGPVDVDADGDFHGIPLLAREGEVELVHVVVPRESADVFRVIRLNNPLSAPLLAGPADVYVDGDYLLTCGLGLAAARGELRLGLGVEQGIKVSRNTSYEEESAGLIGGSLLLKHQISVEVNNRLDRAVAVEVRERVPALREGEDEITLEVGSATPRWERYEPEEYTLRGGYRWRFELAGGARQHLRAGYTAKISAKRELVGGNRREA